MGRSNVGKSTLINTILNRKKVARVSQTPGKTQAIQFYLINERVYVVDLPGYGYARVPREIAKSWGELSKGYFESAEDLRKVFILVDVRREPGYEDRMMIDWLDELAIPWTIVLTKVDKVSNNELAVAKRRVAKGLDIAEPKYILFSSVQRKGISEMWREVDQLIGSAPKESKKATRPGEREA